MKTPHFANQTMGEKMGGIHFELTDAELHASLYECGGAGMCSCGMTDEEHESMFGAAWREALLLDEEALMARVGMEE